MSREGDEGVDIGMVTVLHVTDAALKIRLPDDNVVWIPKSVVHDDSELTADAAVDDVGDLEVRRWFAEKEGLV